MNSDALIDFDAKIFLGEEKVTEEEIRQLLSETEGLAFIKGKWVEVDHKKLTEMLKLLLVVMSDRVIIIEFLKATFGFSETQ